MNLTEKLIGKIYWDGSQSRPTQVKIETAVSAVNLTAMILNGRFIVSYDEAFRIAENQPPEAVMKLVAALKKELLAAEKLASHPSNEIDPLSACRDAINDIIENLWEAVKVSPTESLS